MKISSPYEIKLKMIRHVIFETSSSKISKILVDIANDGQILIEYQRYQKLNVASR